MLSDKEDEKDIPLQADFEVRLTALVYEEKRRLELSKREVILAKVPVSPFMLSHAIDVKMPLFSTGALMSQRRRTKRDLSDSSLSQTSSSGLRFSSSLSDLIQHEQEMSSPDSRSKDDFIFDIDDVGELVGRRSPTRG